jgi:hypothetical protein
MLLQQLDNRGLVAGMKRHCSWETDQVLAVALKQARSDISGQSDDSEDDDRDDGEDDEEGELPSIDVSTSAATAAVAVSVSEDSSRADGGASLTASHDSAQRQRLRVRNRPPRPPRILKQDVRRLMSRMLLTVLNSSDIALIASFFCQHSTPDCRLTMRCRSPSVSFTNTIDGHTLNTAFSVGLMRLVPDKTVEVEQVRLVTQQGSLKCRLEMDICVKGTNLYSILPNLMLQQLLVDFEAFSSSRQQQQHQQPQPQQQQRPQQLLVDRVGSVDAAAATREAVAYTATYDPIDVYRKVHGSIPPVLPLQVYMQGRYIVYFNEQKLIEQMKIFAVGELH